MASGTDHSWKETGWHGVRFSTPRAWEVDRIGDRYILLENDGKPVLEAKWDRVGGGFNPEKVLKNLGSKFSGGFEGRSVHPWKVPPACGGALKRFECEGFKWSGALYSGKGLVLYCNECGRATLLQFYERREKSGENSLPPESLKILASFRDHAVDGKLLWSVFDMRLTLPESFKPISHSFRPGAFQLAFDAGSCKVGFHRFSPASVILCQNDLSSFARKTFSFDENEMISDVSEASNFVEFESVPPISRFRRWRLKLGKKPVYKWAMMWYASESNRILGVEAKGARPFDIALLKTVCEDYGVF